MMMRSSIGAGFWNGEKLVELYEIACRGREETTRVGIRQALSVGRRTVEFRSESDCRD